MRDSLKHQFLMTPKMAVHHEKSAYHRYNTRSAHYQLRVFSEEENTAWEGPSAVDETFGWLRERELQQYHARKGEEWVKQNSDWDQYNPDEDEFLHPNKSSKPLRGRNGARTYGTTRGRVKNAGYGKKEDDLDTVRVIRKGLGFRMDDPLPKPEVNIKKWAAGLSEASKARKDHAPYIDWKKEAAVFNEDDEEIPLPVKVTDKLLHFGLEFAQRARLVPKKRERMHLFLELPTQEKIRRIELLAMRLSEPSLSSSAYPTDSYLLIAPLFGGSHHATFFFLVTY